MKIGSLFAGIGGLELGLECAGLGRTVWQVERDAYAKAVLAKHWPNALRYDDVRTVGAHNLDPVDVLCGGFPCQDVSSAGKGAGLAGARSGLWGEYARLVRELRPRIVVVENVAALRYRGLGRVLGDLAECGYDTLWASVSASDVGAPHKRERIFVVGYPVRERSQRKTDPAHRRQSGLAGTSVLANGHGARQHEQSEGGNDSRDGTPHSRSRVGQADSTGRRSLHVGLRASRRNQRDKSQDERDQPQAAVAQPDVVRSAHGIPEGLDAHRWPARRGEEQHAWEPSRTTGKEAYREDRIRCLGNSVVPQVAYVIGCIAREILEQQGSET